MVVDILYCDCKNRTPVRQNVARRMDSKLVSNCGRHAIGELDACFSKLTAASVGIASSWALYKADPGALQPTT